jgi:hypothetical protein
MSAKFPDKLVFEEAGYAHDSMLLKLTGPFRYYSSLGLVYVPKNFVTDGASIPRVFWSILSPFGAYFPAALVHDFLYSSKNDEFTRDEADGIFLEAMKDCGVPWHRRTIIYSAVRCAGWRFFKGTALT